ncbi:MAG: ATP-binding protein [Thermodesulfobacteriota bacterium]|nr:ATP-binding protein [Thermodesulfobacteriota bacterium]
MPHEGYRNLRLKIIATTLTFSLIPLFVLGASIYYQFHQSYSSKIHENLRAMAENRRHAIDLFFDERISQLTTVAYTTTFDRITAQGTLERLYDLIQSRSRYYVDLGVIDENGEHVAYCGPYKLKGLNYRDTDWFQSVIARGTYISDVFLGFRKVPHFIIAVARREDDHTWILRATINTDLFEAMVRAAQTGRKGDAFLLNRDFVYQTTPRFDGGLLEKNTSLQLPMFMGTRLIEHAVEGRRLLVAATWLENKEWLLVVEQDPGEELLPLFQTRHLTIGLMTAGVIAVVFGTVLVSQLMIRQLIRADREKAELDANLMQSAKLAAVGKLAAGIAHEINNPLAVIREKAGWIRDLLEEEDIQGSDNFAEFADAVEKIEAHVERARTVTHRLLGFARRMEPVEEEVDLHHVLDETIAFLENEARHRNIAIHKEYMADEPTIINDSSQLQQVFLNILNNAIDAVEQDGDIWVRTHRDGKKGSITIEIADNGPGIPPEHLSKIFDPFFTTKRTGSGTGLGLSISYSIVKKLGGDIVVKSNRPKGAVFTLSFPARQGAD